LLPNRWFTCHFGLTWMGWEMARSVCEYTCPYLVSQRTLQCEPFGATPPDSRLDRQPIRL
jgi:hypothetical protein